MLEICQDDLRRTSGRFSLYVLLRDVRLTLTNVMVDSEFCVLQLLMPAHVVSSE